MNKLEQYTSILTQNPQKHNVELKEKKNILPDNVYSMMTCIMKTMKTSIIYHYG